MRHSHTEAPTLDHAPKGTLILEDGTEWTGHSFGAEADISGEVVFNTGMVGYPETLTDPSYRGQILTLTYPMIGNYGIPRHSEHLSLDLPFESERIQIKALIVSNYSENYSHWDAQKSLGAWLKEHNIPAITGIDTRSLTKVLREKGTMLGKVVFNNRDIPMHNQNEENLVADVSPTEKKLYNEGAGKRILMIDCGGKNNIIDNLMRRGVEVLRVPWDHDLSQETFDGVMISNGPGDPKKCGKTVHQIRYLMQKRIPTFGICLGHQLLSLAIGADTFKLKYGHRGQNQPVIEAGTNRCFITSQNHGFAVDPDSLPEGWESWFTNLNDGTNEGIRHTSLPIRSCQFHPEAAPGPVDTEFLFDELIEMVTR